MGPCMAKFHHRRFRFLLHAGADICIDADTTAVPFLACNDSHELSV